MKNIILSTLAATLMGFYGQGQTNAADLSTNVIFQPVSVDYCANGDLQIDIDNNGFTDIPAGCGRAVVSIPASLGRITGIAAGSDPAWISSTVLPASSVTFRNNLGTCAKGSRQTLHLIVEAIGIGGPFVLTGTISLNALSSGCTGYGNLSTSNDNSTTSITTVPINDFGDLDPTKWPVAKAGIATCLTGNVPKTWDGSIVKTVSVFAGNTVSKDAATNASFETTNDGLGFPPGTFTAGYSVPFLVTPNSNKPGTTAFYRMWFDWNNDGDFTNDVDGNGAPATYAGSSASNGMPITVNVKPPIGASPIYKVRLVVSSTYLNDVYRDAGAASLMVVDNGEIEDYAAPALILPLTFAELAIKAQNCGVSISFAAVSEQGNREFRISQSTDGNTWRVVGTIASKGDGTHTYNFTDLAPAVGKSFYRIQQIDKSNVYTYSKTMEVKSDCSGKGAVLVYPNPLLIDQSLNVQVPQGDKFYVTIRNAIGQLLVSTSVAGASSSQYDLHAWASGVYEVVVSNSKKEILASKKIIKK